jgi:type IV pilus assembly protein PilY1
MDDQKLDGTIEPGDDVYLFFGLGRGGQAYYALDVSDPESPRLLWTIEKGGDFAELGYTFSRPRVGHVDIGDGRQPVVIFGGGYDLNKDDRSGTGSDDSEGAAIYVVDARTGNLIWKAVGGTGASGSSVFVHPDLRDSIPSGVTIADTDGDGLTDRILVGDTGGNVWRVDLAGTDTSDWKLTRLAKLGRHAESGQANDRRFFHRPDLVPSRDESGPFDAVVIGSGNRQDPLDYAGTVTNYLYVLKDRNVAKGTGTDRDLTPSQLGDVTDNCLQEGSGCSVNLANGWKLRLEQEGEKALATPVTIAGTVFFTTYIPPGELSGGSCSPAEGSGRLYAVALRDERAVMNYDATVDPDEDGRGTTKSDRHTVLNSPGIPSEVVFLPPNMILRPDLQPEEIGVSTRWRTFWFIEEDSDL